MHHHSVATSLTDHQIATISVNGIFPAVAALFIVLRLCAKRIKHSALFLDDWLILLGFVGVASILHNYGSNGSKIFVLGNSGPFLYGELEQRQQLQSGWTLTKYTAAVKGGMGEHLSNLTEDQMTIFGLVSTSSLLRLNVSDLTLLGDILDSVPLHIRRSHYQIFDPCLLPKHLLYSQLQTRHKANVCPSDSVDDCLFLCYSIPSLAYLLQLAINRRWIYHQRGHDVQRPCMHRVNHGCHDPYYAPLCHLDAAAKGVEEVGYFGYLSFGRIVRLLYPLQE